MAKDKNKSGNIPAFVGLWCCILQAIILFERPSAKRIGRLNGKEENKLTV